MISSPNSTVDVRVSDGVCTITLDRPERLNAIDRDMAAALAAVTGAVADDATMDKLTALHDTTGEWNEESGTGSN